MAKKLYKNGGDCTGACNNCPNDGQCFSDCPITEYYDAGTG